MAARTSSQTGQARRNAGERPPAGPDPDGANHYQLLGVAYTASAADITKAYRTAMKRFHPDRVPPERRAAAEELCKDLNRAYKTLSNPVDRVAYDRTVRSQEVQDQIMQRYVGGFAEPGGGGIDPFAAKFKRELTSEEKADRRKSERSAMLSVISVFLVVTLGAIGLILIAALLSWIVQALV
ncbi:MAG: J domain-containing protein [Chloroflexota bacterium]|nr:J domain-containing protein [Chloroflexota bacterium]